MAKAMRFALWFAVVGGLLSAGCGAGTTDSGSATIPSAGNLGDLEKPDVFWADPPIIQACEGEVGQTTLHWQAAGAARVEVRVGMPEGALFALANPEGEKLTGNWVKDGMVFYLVDADSREPIAASRVRVTRAGCPN